MTSIQRKVEESQASEYQKRWNSLRRLQIGFFVSAIGGPVLFGLLGGSITFPSAGRGRRRNSGPGNYALGVMYRFGVIVDFLAMPSLHQLRFYAMVQIWSVFSNLPALWVTKDQHNRCTKGRTSLIQFCVLYLEQSISRSMVAFGRAMSASQYLLSQSVNGLG